MAKIDKKLTTDAAIEVARQAACELSEQAEQVGEYLGAIAEGERLVSHRFNAQVRGYRGWHWNVVVARAPRSASVTVCEAHLQPGDDAILAKPWVPYADRLQPGDLGPTDVLPFKADDPRLEPGWVPTGTERESDLIPIEELALARARVLSQDGTRAAAQRWYRGRSGPRTTSSVVSDQPCYTCGFIVPLQGSLGQLFGVCVNEWSDDDGRVVSFDHGCGAHSETDAPRTPVEWPAPGPSYGELDLEIVDLATVEASAPEEPTEPAPAAETPAEPEDSGILAEPEAAHAPAEQEPAGGAQEEEPALVQDAVGHEEQPVPEQTAGEQPETVLE